MFSVGSVHDTAFVHPTRAGAGAGLDSAWEQEKLEARKMLKNAAELPASSAGFVGLPLKIIVNS